MDSYTPKTRLGKRLIEIREKAIKRGIKLLTVDEVLILIKNRRVGK